MVFVECDMGPSYTTTAYEPITFFVQIIPGVRTAVFSDTSFVVTGGACCLLAWHTHMCTSAFML